MFTWGVFITVFCCSTLCWSFNFDVNSNQDNLRRDSRQAKTTPEVKLANTCPSRTSSSLDIKCSRNGIEVDCSKPVLHGTVANVSCKEFYHFSLDGDSVPPPYNHLLCEDGSWDEILTQCIPVCGKRNLKKRVRRIVGGDKADIGEYPWHVGIYLKIKISNSTKFTQICSGSIISPKVVITAAHCFDSQNPIDYSVAAGKYYRKWNDTRDANAQLRNITKLYIHERYKGFQINFANDIAILIMDKPFVLNNLVSPVCVDWTTKNYEQLLVNGSIGYVAGWGLDHEFGDSSEELKHIQLPYVPFEKCFNKSDPDFRPVVGFPDKICAGRTDGQNVCTGDGGGGLTFQLDGIFYLMGITSIGPDKAGSCDVSKYTTFTKFSFHTKWAENISRFNSGL